METLKTILLYLLVIFLVFMGSMHFITPDAYRAMIPDWLPAPQILIPLSGVFEIALGILLIPIKTRAMSAQAIILLLIVFFFAIHVPQSIQYYKIQHEDFVSSLIRLPVQFLFIGWASLFSKKEKRG